MAASKLQILIEALYKGKGAKDAQKDLKGMEKGVAMLDSAWVKAGLAGGAVFAAVAVGKKVFVELNPIEVNESILYIKKNIPNAL